MPHVRCAIQNIILHDRHAQLILVDCSAKDFDDSEFSAANITRANMMQALHVQDAQGEWIVGVPAFELIYRSIGLTAIANFWGGKYTGAFASKIYPWVARHRQLISLTGAQFFFTLWGKLEARRAQKRSRLCHDNQCSR